MMYWGDVYFMEANCPLMEQMIFFHDHSMIIIFMILVFLFVSLLDLLTNIFLNLSLIENQVVEMIWTLFPVFILMFIAVPSLRLLYLMEEIYISDMSVKVFGFQWYWSYEYMDFELKLDCFIESDDSLLLEFRLLETDTFLFLPLNVFVSLFISSNDVIHSWTVQSLGVKTDAVPGRLNQLNLFFFRPGLYFGQCSEICGINHSFMPISVMITSVEMFIMYLNYFLI